MKLRIHSLTACSIGAWMLIAPLGSGAAAQVSPAAPVDPARIEKGRQVVAQACATCHATLGRMIQVHKQTPQQWKDTVYFMISRGAQIMPDEIESVVAFLAATAGSGAQTTPAPTGRGRGGGGGPAPQTAETDGRAILQRNCQQCHELATATKRPAAQDWAAVIARMTSYGARLTSAEQQALIAYLNGL